jgi:hypothetical protein
MLRRTVSVLAVLALLLVSKVHSFAPSSPFLSAGGVLPRRLASSVQVQTLSDESAATEPAATTEAPVAEVAPPVLVVAESGVVLEEAEASSSSSADVEVAALPKRKVERTRYTAFVGNLPYGT